jgi:hypothetical protein
MASGLQWVTKNSVPGATATALKRRNGQARIYLFSYRRTRSSSGRWRGSEGTAALGLRTTAGPMPSPAPGGVKDRAGDTDDR